MIWQRSQGLLVVELELPSGFFYKTKDCKGVDNGHYHTKFAELQMSANILAASLESWIKHLNVHTFLEIIPKKKSDKCAKIKVQYYSSF